MDEEPAVIRSPDISEPIRHGPWLMVPFDWSGRREPPKGGDPLRVTGITVEAQVAAATAGVAGASDAWPADVWPAAEWFQTWDAAEARRRIPNWRDPVLPAGWTLSEAQMGTMNSPRIGYKAEYGTARGGTLMLYVLQVEKLPVYQWASAGTRLVTDLRIIDGHAALVRGSPPGPRHDPRAVPKIEIFDNETNTKYVVFLFVGTTGEAVEIARSLYRTPSP